MGQTRPQLTRHGRESKRKADTEIQYRPPIVDTDIDSLTLQSLLFSISLLFPFPIFLALLGCFCFAFQGFSGCREEKILVFFGISLAFFQKGRVGGLWTPFFADPVSETLI